MVAHVVLLQPRATLGADQREALLESMRIAFTGIPEIKRVRIGRRVLIGRGYETLMTESFEYSAIIEFDSDADLRVYLDHPRHQELGKLFFQSVDAALVYDFTTVEPDRVRELL